MTRALLDVNVLLALLDSDHVDDATARSWLNGEIEGGWASCAITENGFVRILSQPRYPGPIPAAQAALLLDRARQGPHHAFWPCALSILDTQLVDWSRVHGPAQVTDAYLLALAVAHEGRLATFDRSLSVECVRGAGREHLAVL